jgi:hypothetical protein
MRDYTWRVLLKEVVIDDPVPDNSSNISDTQPRELGHGFKGSRLSERKGLDKIETKNGLDADIVGPLIYH